MSVTKTKKPSAGQLAILEALNATRYLVVTETTTADKVKTKLTVVTKSKGNAVPVNGPLSSAAVAGCVKAGWLNEVGGDSGSVNDVSTKNTQYEITEDGKAARKIK